LFFALLDFQATVLYGQTLTGTWQGVLKRPDAPNGELRIVIKVSTTEADKLAATMYFIDRGTTLVPSSAVTTNGAGLKMSFERINGTWEGRLSADGKTLDGTWTQYEPRPLVLARATAETAWTIPDPPPPHQMMDPKAAPGFEVATIKPSNPAEPGYGIRVGVSRSGTITTRNTTLLYLVKFAYDLHPKQVIGAPVWIDADEFDITAKPDQPGFPTVRQMQSILQKLLAERFGLVFHKEKRELSAYTITVAKGGEKIKKEEDTPEPAPSFGGAPSGYVVRNATMAEFVSFVLLPLTDQPMVDQTGLGETRYSFILKFTPDPGMLAPGADPDAQPPAPDADAPPDIFTAMEQQLGLHVQKTKAPVDVMVIDRVSKPSEN
jgi:uncharacterized protein (TIGR03435 family)